MPRWLRPFCGSETRHKIIYVRETEREVPESTPPPPPPPERVATTTRQVCSACGKFRSPSWSARNPLKLGEAPRASLCKRCADISTSSEDSGRRHRRKRYRHHSRTVTNSFENSRSSDEIRRLRRRLRHLSNSLLSDEVQRSHRRYHRQSDSSAHGTPRSRAGSMSTEGVNIFIQNSGGKSRSRVRTVSSSSESIRITRRVSYDQSPRHRRTSSFEDVFVSERHLPRRRSLSRARRGSRSSVHFEDEIERARIRPRSDSRSHESHYSGPVDEVFPSRFGTGVRRRGPMYFDGIRDSRPDDSVQTRSGDNVRDQNVTQSPRQYVRSSASVSERQKCNANKIPVYESPQFSPRRASSQLRSGGERGDLRSDPTGSKGDFPPTGFAPQDSRPPPPKGKGKSGEQNLNEYGYEVDSQTPTPPKVTYTFPAAAKRGAPQSSPLGFKHWSSQGDNQYDPLRPMHAKQSSSSPRPPPNMQRPPPCCDKFPGHGMMPDNPAHPDHLAYMMSGARITSDNIDGGNQPPDHHSDRCQWDGPLSSKRAPNTPTPAARVRRKGEEMPNCQAGQSLSSERKRRTGAGHDVDYEAEGRAWMERVRRQNAERQGRRRGTGPADDV